MKAAASVPVADGCGVRDPVAAFCVLDVEPAAAVEEVVEAVLDVGDDMVDVENVLLDDDEVVANGFPREKVKSEKDIVGRYSL